ncbi:MAG: hypothetical protein KGM44_06715 [bacterium]|nr:hypothetical protein [bacterium]
MLRRLLRAKTYLGVLLAAAFLFGAAGTAVPPETTPNPPDVDHVIDQVAALHSEVRSYTFDLRLHIVLRTFPWVRFRLKGAGAYQKDGPYVLEIANMPGFAKSYGHVSLAYLDPQTWSKDYTMSVSRRSGDTVVLLLHDRKKSALREALATFDMRSGLREIVWRYDYGGVIDLTFAPDKDAGYALPGTLDADIVMPQYHAKAHADFTNYRVVTGGDHLAQTSEADGR